MTLQSSYKVVTNINYLQLMLKKFTLLYSQILLSNQQKNLKVTLGL